MQLVDISGNVVASYEYDPYGNIVASSGSMASINPLRYRGYYFDSETGFYYCQSRYYDPQVGRFINADSYTSTGQGILGNNMFAYCRNSPVFRVDKSGMLDFECDDDTEELSSGKKTDWTVAGGEQAKYSKSISKSGGGRSGFRSGLQNATGKSWAGHDAHHVFPVHFEEEFDRIGIKIHNPAYGAWWESSSHRQASYEYNLWWDAFWNTQGVTYEDAFALADFLSKLFGFDTNY